MEELEMMERMKANRMARVRVPFSFWLPTHCYYISGHVRSVIMANAKTEGLSEEELKILRARFRMRQNRFTAISGACTSRPDEEPTIFEKIKTKLQPVKAKIKTRTIVVTHPLAKSEKIYEGEEKSTRSAYAYSTVSSQYSTVMSELSERSVRSTRKFPDGASEKSSNSTYGKLLYSSLGKSGASTYGKLPSADSNSRSAYGRLSSEATEKRIRRRKEGTEQSERSVRRKFAGKDGTLELPSRSVQTRTQNTRQKRSKSQSIHSPIHIDSDEEFDGSMNHISRVDAIAFYNASGEYEGSSSKDRTYRSSMHITTSSTTASSTVSSSDEQACNLHTYLPHS